MIEADEAAALSQAVSAVAPVHGVIVGKPDDRATWRADCLETASEGQRAAAAAVIAGWDRIAYCRSVYARRVDSDAETARLQFMTPGSGMAMTYQEKFAQAQAVQSMGETAANALSRSDREAQFPTLSASVGIEAPTLWECAALILTRYAAFAASSLMIERARLAGKASIRAAATVDDVRAAYEAIVWPTR